MAENQQVLNGYMADAIKDLLWVMRQHNLATKGTLKIEGIVGGGFEAVIKRDSAEAAVRTEDTALSVEVKA